MCWQEDLIIFSEKLFYSGVKISAFTNGSEFVEWNGIKLFFFFFKTLNLSLCFRAFTSFKHTFSSGGNHLLPLLLIFFPHNLSLTLSHYCHISFLIGVFPPSFLGFIIVPFLSIKSVLPSSLSVLPLAQYLCPSASLCLLFSPKTSWTCTGHFYSNCRAKTGLKKPKQDGFIKAASPNGFFSFSFFLHSQINSACNFFTHGEIWGSLKWKSF